MKLKVTVRRALVRALEAREWGWEALFWASVHWLHDVDPKVLAAQAGVEGRKKTASPKYVWLPFPPRQLHLLRLGLRVTLRRRLLSDDILQVAILTVQVQVNGVWRSFLG